MAKVRIKRGTRAQLEAAATAGTLAVGEPYLITDEGRMAVGTSPSAFAAVTKQGEAGLAGPATPTLVSPADGAVGGKNFTVSAYSHPLGVPKWCTQIERARDAAFAVDAELSSISTQNTATDITLSWIDRVGANYCRVRDIDVFGVASAWSAPRAYTTPAGTFSGGTLTQDGAYSVRTFTASGTLTIAANSVADVLIVAGGGGGGEGVGGGGGGGGVAYFPGKALAAGTYAVTIGAGGAPGDSGIPGGKGGSSSIAGIAPVPGGAGGTAAMSSGASGGAKATAIAGGGAGDGGNSTGTGAGGGGAGAAGSPAVYGTAGGGGAGFACGISPVATHYSGGGGGGAMAGYGEPASGGPGGGGSGSKSSVGANGQINTGGGGGGGGYGGMGVAGGSGGSGIVIIRYQV